VSLVAAMLVVATAGPAAAFAGVPNVTIVRYPVEGSDPAAIRASLDARRPTVPDTGVRVDALTRWDIGWRWRGSRADRCGLSNAVVGFSATVQLPRLATAVAPDVKARWDAYLAALAAHEARHARAAYAARTEVLAALRGATCATANAAGEAVLATIRARDAAVDRATDHGRTEGAVFE